MTSHGQQSADSPAQWWTVPFAMLSLAVVFGAVYSYKTLLNGIAGANALATHVAVGFGMVIALLLIMGFRTGPMADRHGPARLLGLGALAIAVAYGVLAALPTTGVVVLVFAFGLGVGAGMVFTPIVSTTGQRFDRQRALALGVTMVGVGLGTTAFPPLVAHGLDVLAWRTVTVIVGAAVAAALGVAALALRRPLPTRSAAQAGAAPGMTRRQVWRDGCFRLMYAAAVATGLCTVIPFLMLADAAITGGASRVAGAALVSGIGIASTASRLLAGPLARAVGVLAAYAAAHVVLFLSFAIWYFSQSYTGLWVVALMFGTGYGWVISSTPAALARVYGAPQLGRNLGMLYTASAPGALIAPALAATLRQSAGLRTSLTLFVAVSLLSAGFAVAAILVASSPRRAATTA